jgi:hypothetical protein
MRLRSASPLWKTPSWLASFQLYSRYESVSGLRQPDSAAEIWPAYRANEARTTVWRDSSSAYVNPRRGEKSFQVTWPAPPA